MRLTERFSWRGRDVAWGSGGSGPPVVFCHGTPWSSRLWEPFADALTGEFTVYLWDMPGYGVSSKRDKDAVDLDVQGQVFTDLLAHWGLERPHVVAHDFGGAVSLRALLLHDASYASLALVDVVALRPWGSEYFRLVADNANVFSAQPEAVHRGALEAYIGGASHRGLSAVERDMLSAPWLGDEGQAAFYQQIAQADERFTAEIEDRYHQIDIPVTLIWGAEDAWIPADRAHRLAAMIPGCEVVIVADAGHLIQLDQPVALATQLHAWLVHHGGRAP